MRIYRHAALYGPTGIFVVGKSKYFKDFVERDGADDEFIPGTKIKRLKVIHLGPQARGVPEDEVKRVSKALSFIAVQGHGWHGSRHEKK